MTGCYVLFLFQIYRNRDAALVLYTIHDLLFSESRYSPDPGVIFQLLITHVYSTEVEQAGKDCRAVRRLGLLQHDNTQACRGSAAAAGARCGRICSRTPECFLIPESSWFPGNYLSGRYRGGADTAAKLNGPLFCKKNSRLFIRIPPAMVNYATLDLVQKPAGTAASG